MDRSAPDPDADDLYQRLGLPRTASSRDVKKAFRAAAALVHPDQSDAHRDGLAFRRVCEARDVLSDWQRRRDYDKRSPESASTTAHTPPPRPPREPARPQPNHRTPPSPGAVLEPSWFGALEPVFPVVRPWVEAFRNAACVVAVVGSGMLVNAALATDPQRLLDHWPELITWDVRLLVVLYVSVPITLHLLVLAMRPPGSPSRRD